MISEESPRNLFGASATSFLDNQYERMGLASMGVNKDDFMSNIFKFAQNTRGIESDNNPYAASNQSTAKGVYQFTDASVDTGRQRMLNMGFDPEIARNIPQDPRDWSDEDADAMFLANIFAQKGSDDYLYRVGIGEPGADRDAYYKFHHTDPDQATMDRANKFFSKSLQDEIMESNANLENAFK